MIKPEKMTDTPEQEPEQEAGQPSIGGEKISAEMNAALHAAKEIDDAQKADGKKEHKATDSAAEVKETLDAILGEDEEPLQTAPQAATEDETAALRDQLIRTMAEMENLRKRNERDMADSRKYAVTGFARDLVNVVEHLQMALQSVTPEDRKGNDKLDNLVQGVEMTYNELIRTFQNHGIVRIDPKGEKFNHNHHQAVAQVEDPNAEPGTVTQVLQAGYIIHDRLLRPAMVTVAKSGDKAESISTEA